MTAVDYLAQYLDLEERRALLESVLNQDIRKEVTQSLRERGLLQQPANQIPQMLWEFMPLVLEAPPDLGSDQSLDTTLVVPCNHLTLRVLGSRCSPGIMLVQIAELTLHLQQVYAGYVSAVASYLGQKADLLLAEVENYKYWEDAIQAGLERLYFADVPRTRRVQLAKSDPALLELSFTRRKLSTEHTTLKHRVQKLEDRLKEVSRNISARETELRISGFNGAGIGDGPGPRTRTQTMRGRHGR